MSVILTAGTAPLSFAASEPQLNFKIYSPDSNSSQPATAAPASETADPAGVAGSTGGATTTEPATDADKVSAEKAADPIAGAGADKPADAAAEKPADSVADKPAEKTPDATTEVLKKEEPISAAPASVESKPADQATQAAAGSTSSSTDTTASTESKSTSETATPEGEKKVLQGYIRVVPKETKVPIIMDTAVDSDTSQEGDEFAARTSEDITVDGAIVVPAGSIIKGRIASLNAPKHLNRSGSVALKFDTVTTPDNRQIPLVANLVAHGGVVHARRGLKDIAIDGGVIALPLAAGLGIGALAGGSSSSSSTGSTTTGTTSSSSKGVGHAGGAMIGAGIGLAVGVAILLAKKGKKVDVRPGDELKIELAEDLRMPMM